MKMNSSPRSGSYSCQRNILGTIDSLVDPHTVFVVVALDEQSSVHHLVDATVYARQVEHETSWKYEI